MLENTIQSTPRLVRKSGLGTLLGQTPKALVDSPAVCIAEEAFLRIFSLRQSRLSEGHAAVDAWLQAQQMKRPEAANGLSGSFDLGTCWLEPNAWLVTAHLPLKEVTPDAGLAATLISDRLASFQLRGPAVREVLSAGFDPTPLKKGRAMRTRLAGFATVLVQQWDATEYRLLVDVSLARACAGWLRENCEIVASQ